MSVVWPIANMLDTQKHCATSNYKLHDLIYSLLTNSYLRQHVLRIGVAEVCTDVAHYLLSEPTYSSKYVVFSKIHSIYFYLDLSF